MAAFCQIRANSPRVRPAGGQMRVEIPQDMPKTTYAAVPPPPAGSGTSWLKIFVVVGLVIIMFVVAAGIAGALIYFNKDARSTATNNANKEANRPTPTPTAANSETDKLRDQIANLEKRLNEQKNSNTTIDLTTPAPPDQPSVTSTTATVNSPGDGFLALRSLPNSDLGERILQIPHGATVKINGCLARTRIGNKTGRWCRASYGSYNGWVFDAWLTY
jgi:hypothetical protein